MEVFTIISRYAGAFSRGLLVTLELSTIVWVSGILFGFVLGSAGAHWSRVSGRLVSMGSFILSGMPILVLLFWLHYPMQAMLKVVINPFLTAAFALSLVNTFAVAETVRLALADFPAQYVAAARVSGLTPWETLRYIKIPILLRQILPTLLAMQVTMLQATLFASLISVEEIFRVAQQINALIYKPVEIYSALGTFFLLVCLPLNGLALWLKARFTRNLSEA